MTAADIVNEAAERELATIFRRYGEERYARQIARAIVRRREEQPFERTGELVETIKAAIPAPARFGDGHPAKRVFQALRIAVNDELGSLEAALPAALDDAAARRPARGDQLPLARGPDRQALHARPRARLHCPPDFPVCVCGHEPELRVADAQGVRPTAAEIAREPARRVGAAARRGEGLTWPPGPPQRPRAAAGRRRGRAARVVQRQRARLAGGVVWIASSPCCSRASSR